MNKLHRTRLASKPFYRQTYKTALELLLKRNEPPQMYYCPLCEFEGRDDSNKKYTLVQVNQHMLAMHTNDHMLLEGQKQILLDQAMRDANSNIDHLTDTYLACPLCLLDGRYNVYISNPAPYRLHLRSHNIDNYI